MSNKNISGTVKLIVSIGICLSAGFLGSFFTTPAIPVWYAGIIKPSFAPPNWVFFPIWTVLFVMMGISLYLVWQKDAGEQKVKKAIFIFCIQLILNVLWSAAFFGWRSPFAGFMVILILWISIALTVISFMKISKTAGVLLIPYIAWVTFAAVLNFLIWRLNN
ncbi:MAG: TspO/MBR family protein [Candidatus Methanoperedens sp.]